MTRCNKFSNVGKGLNSYAFFSISFQRLVRRIILLLYILYYVRSAIRFILIVCNREMSRVMRASSVCAETLVSAYLDVSSRGAADAGSAVGRAATHAIHRPEQHERGIRTDRVSHA